MAKSRFIFSNSMSLEAYKKKLGQEGGTSADQPVGETYGSFLGAYLTYHLMHRPEGVTAEGVLERDKKDINALITQNNCKITFETTRQLPDFFKFLTAHVDIYLALVDSGFLEVDAQCHDGNTFLNTYFSEKLIDKQEDADEAIGLLNRTKPCLTIANNEGVIPLGAFVNQLTLKTTKEIEESVALFWRWSQLSDGFSLDDNVDGVKISHLVAVCVDYYNKHKANRFALTVLYYILTKAAQYGVGLHESIPGLDNDSFMLKMLKSDDVLHWDASTLREYYLSLKKESRTLKMQVGKGVKQTDKPIGDHAEAGITGLVRISGLDGYKNNHRRYLAIRNNQLDQQKLFDPFAARKFVPLDVWGEIFNNKSGDRIPLIPENGVMRLETFIDTVFTWVKLDSIPEEMRFGLPGTFSGQSVLFRFTSKYLTASPGFDLTLNLFDRKTQTWVNFMDNRNCNYDVVKSFRQKYSGAISTFQDGYLRRLKEALADQANYHPRGDYYKQVMYRPESTHEVNLLEYYLRHGGNGKADNLSGLYQFKRSFVRRTNFDSRLASGPIKACYQSADGDIWKYWTENIYMERYEQNISIDMEILRHFRKIGYDFKAEFVADIITDLLKHGNLADLTLYHLMCCLAECGAKFPATIDGKGLSLYIQEGLQGVDPGIKIDAYAKHFAKVIEIFKDEKAGKTVDELLRYLGDFGVAIPIELKSFADISGYLSDPEVLRSIVVKIDSHYPNVSERQFNIKADALQFVNSIQDAKGNAQLAWVGLKNYVESGEYQSLDGVKEEAYFQLYFNVIRKSCEAFQLALAQAMNGIDSKAGRPSLWVAVKTIKRNAKVAIHGGVTQSVANKLGEILGRSPGSAVDRTKFLTLYSDLISFVQGLRPSDEKEAKDKVPTRTVRNLFDMFLKTGCLGEGTIDVTDEMQHALEVLLTPVAAMMTPGPVVGEYQPPYGSTKSNPNPNPNPNPPIEYGASAYQAVDDSSPTLGATPTPTGSEDVDDETFKSVLDGFLPSAPSESKQDKQKRGKQVNMFSERKDSPPAEFITEVESYYRRIDDLFYNEKSRDHLIDVIGAINDSIKDGVSLDSTRVNCICPLTERVPLYPCGLKGQLVYLDIKHLMLYCYGKYIEGGVLVNKSTIEFLVDRELISFISQVQMLHQSLGLTLKDTPKPNRP